DVHLDARSEAPADRQGYGPASGFRRRRRRLGRHGPDTQRDRGQHAGVLVAGSRESVAGSRTAAAPSGYRLPATRYRLPSHERPQFLDAEWPIELPSADTVAPHGNPRPVSRLQLHVAIDEHALELGGAGGGQDL